MTSAKLFIPKKLKIGFVNRSDSFTKKLGYVIYYDEKGVLRKQNSWESWRDKSIEPIELDNAPTTGYILNRGVKRCGDWRHSGSTFVRMYDPRDFEFEINVSNLIGVMSHSDVLHNEIQQECVFAWNGTELVLLPTNSEQYETSLVHTSKQDKKISSKDLIPGATYEKRRGDDQYIYIGFYPWYSFETEYPNGYGGVVNYHHRLRGKKHIFSKVVRNSYEPEYEAPGVAGFAECVNEIPVANLAALVDGYYKTNNASPVVDLCLDYDIEKYIDPNSDNPLVRLDVNTAEKTFANVVRLHWGKHCPKSFGWMKNSGYDVTSIVFDADNVAVIQSGRDYTPNAAQRAEYQYHMLHEEYKKEHVLGSNADIPISLRIQWAKELKLGVLLEVLANGNVTTHR